MFLHILLIILVHILNALNLNRTFFLPDSQRMQDIALNRSSSGLQIQTWKIVNKKKKLSNRQTLNLGNHWVKRLSGLTAALSLIINNRDVVRLECALTGIPVGWCQSFSMRWIHTHTLMHARGSNWRVGKGHGGLTNTNIWSSEHNKYCLCSIWEGWHTEKPSSNTHSHKIIILSAIQLYFKFFLRVITVPGEPCIFPKNLPRSFPTV